MDARRANDARAPMGEDAMTHDAHDALPFLVPGEIGGGYRGMWFIDCMKPLVSDKGSAKSSSRRGGPMI